MRIEGAYHGWQGDVAVSSRPILSKPVYSGRPERAPDSAGVLESVSKEVLIVSANDSDALRATFDDHGAEIAAVILEPVSYSMGCVPLDREYVQLARSLCSSHEAVLIFDEVLTGFRCDIRGLGPVFDVSPDLAAYGKAIANGYMMSMLAGREALMEQLRPSGPSTTRARSMPIHSLSQQPTRLSASWSEMTSPTGFERSETDSQRASTAR